ncbi:hypothetical protein [Massilia haematophila]|uniref:Uncharacterized protein n=1 Tax=Massilia haematophila TaxID=457923 RepID=A0ABV7PKX8_9BURK
MAKNIEYPGAHGARRLLQNGLLAMSMLASISPARATPAPPPLAPLLRQADMTVTVRLIEAKNGVISKFSTLCKVGGKIPVYADNGPPASFNPAKIEGCSMPRKGGNLEVSVWGAKAVSASRGAYATAGVDVIPPGAAPACAHHLCGPQPLADSRAEIRVSGTPERMQFSLHPNPASVLKARPSVWLEAEVEIVD